ncbi:threonine/homoserine efflux transporter RhtA [Litoreibacter halocynthiae]|uniref:Threonine/homoserine efflux transporter RhtA n=1 Tax=Litoreibacter halocynthiae TaxID=1242689 RepID=A0A4R7LHM1_9RHOB|nr:DMT family transporter [Litoreibacter halocynthiae]TDT75273.1 threonine/homoserine efflux transporter RhtA [Litoreibacter halocynthiae]
MRLFLLTALTMVAFAANSVLNKLGVSRGGMEPLDFAMLRLWSGALMLLLLIWVRRKPVTETGSLIGTASLLVYMLGFSLAYVTLEAGVGALILFGVVQITMFAAAAIKGERIPALRYIGCGIAFSGLAALLWPVGGEAPDVWGAILMAAAGVGWGVYTLVGRSAAAPLLRTERNFRYAALFMVAIAVVIGLPMGTPLGYMAAVVSGAVTSALGYALWYRVLPQLPTTIAATAQLTVPVIALAGGIAFLDEALTLRFALASVLVLGGVALALRPTR